MTVYGKLDLKLGLDSQLAEYSCRICTYLLCSISQVLISWSSELLGLLGHAVAPIQRTHPGFYPSMELGHD